MMNKIEEAILYATVMHQGKVRKTGLTRWRERRRSSVTVG